MQSSPTKKTVVYKWSSPPAKTLHLSPHWWAARMAALRPEDTNLMSLPSLGKNLCYRRPTYLRYINRYTRLLGGNSNVRWSRSSVIVIDPHPNNTPTLPCVPSSSLPSSLLRPRPSSHPRTRLFVSKFVVYFCGGVKGSYGWWSLMAGCNWRSISLHTPFCPATLTH